MKIYFLFIIIVFLASCSSKPAASNELQSIQKILQQERTAHFEHNAALFTGFFADSMVSVNKGKVTKASRQQLKERFQHYFDQSEFIKWDDVAAPQIHFSNDSSLAYAIVQKEVIIAIPDSLGIKHNDTTQFAWVSIYRKHNGEWKGECNISTNK